ncbi:type IX secretion system outer membrane channel protein PorV [Mucilaginibacter sp.]|uniref:type IX secretion system outer membrane channel protein PorV n=1 Tax=Mucilaginibacter sp. TaxID=1882438 RepID=UPI003D10FFEB
MRFLYTIIIVFCIALLIPFLGFSQTSGANTIVIPNTEVPFLNLTPDSRSGAMGDAGVAISPDVNANYWNPSKLAFLETNDNVSISYSPWLRQLVPDISLSYLSYAHKIDDRNTIGASLRYFNYGSIQLTDDQQNNLGTYTPNEFSLNGSFARKFGDDFSLGLTVGYIHSSFSSSSFSGSSGGSTSKAGNAISAGVSMFYTKQMQEFGTDATFSFGTNISNIGSKISYSDNGPKYFLPANLKIGVANTWNLDDYNELTFALDLNKLLVPTPPIRDANGNIIKGKDDNVSVPAGIFGSFTDAPNGGSQELQQITLSPGLEYWYNKLFALRVGYFYQNANNNGGAHYLTTGVGFKYNDFTFDFSYLAARQQNSGLANTLRFTLSASFGGDKNVYKRQ